MEELQNKVQENTSKKKDIQGIHANAILKRNVANIHDIEKRIDAICMDEKIAKKVLWEEIYQAMKPQLQIDKKFLDTKDKKEILELPEFKEFFEKYREKQVEKEKNRIKNKTIENIQDELGKKAAPEDIKLAKNQESIFNNIKNNINIIMKKHWGERFFNVLKRNILDVWQTNQIYEYIFEYIETANNKKKRSKNETIAEFYKRSGIDYRCTDENKKIINKEIDKRVMKLKEKIKKREDKEKTTVEKKVKKENIEEEKKDYTQEALDIFLNQIRDYPSIRERFYLPEDKEDILWLQSYFKKHLEETIPSPSKESIIKDYDTPLHTIVRTESKIKMNPNDYIEIERRKMEYKNKFITGKRNPREYLFDRLIEYVGKDILEYKINNQIKKSIPYKWTKCSIEKTDVLDDSSAGADYIVTYTIPGKIKKRIAAVDLFISEKNWWKNIDEDNNDKRKQKKESAKTGIIPYSTYIHMFADKKESSYTMEPLKRYVEQLDPTLVYSIMAQIFKEKKTDISNLLESFDTKGYFYTKIRETTTNNKEITNNIHEQLHQNIFKELEKIAA